ncbi:MAG: hypothetical protein ACM3S0_02120, partial [Acidobacteriota bacterium]
ALQRNSVNTYKRDIEQRGETLEIERLPYELDLRGGYASSAAIGRPPSAPGTRQSLPPAAVGSRPRHRLRRAVDTVGAPRRVLELESKRPEPKAGAEKL